MTLAELQVENRDLRDKLHKANQRIAELEGKQPAPSHGKDPGDRSRESTYKKVDTVKPHG